MAKRDAKGTDCIKIDEISCVMMLPTCTAEYMVGPGLPENVMSEV
jgi:hypothetical protein